MCESCAGDMGRGGICNACGQNLSRPLTQYQYPDPSFCMTKEEEILSRHERNYLETAHQIKKI